MKNKRKYQSGGTKTKIEITKKKEKLKKHAKIDNFFKFSACHSRTG